METGQLLELKGETGGEEKEKERRSIQKERDRERRRLRDRQRRKSMSLEEREIHLARRRKNYQLRRQRAAAANAKLGIAHQTAVAESSVRIDCEMQFSTDYVNNQPQNPSVHHLINHGETALPGRYRYPGSLRLTQIKQIIRLLNFCPEKPCLEITVPNGIPRKGIRLVHLKNLIRIMNSDITTISTEQNNSDNNIQEEEIVVEQEEEEEESDDRRLLLWNEKAIDAIDENEQICADGKCIL